MVGGKKVRENWSAATLSGDGGGPTCRRRRWVIAGCYGDGGTAAVERILALDGAGCDGGGTPVATGWTGRFVPAQIDFAVARGSTAGVAGSRVLAPIL